MTLWLEFIIKFFISLELAFDNLLDELIVPFSAGSNNSSLYLRLVCFIDLAFSNIHPKKDRVSKSIYVWIKRAESLTEKFRKHWVNLMNEIS
jgi:hypothetical protein